MTNPAPVHAAAQAPDQPLLLLDAAAHARLRWRCRRGLLENDLLLQRFFDRFNGTLTRGDAYALEWLMELPDPDLLDLLLARRSAVALIPEMVHEPMTARLLSRLLSSTLSPTSSN